MNSDSESTKTFHVRVQSNRAYTYGLGEEICLGIHLFRAPKHEGDPGHYDLDAEQLAQAIKGTAPQRQRREPRR